MIPGVAFNMQSEKKVTYFSTFSPLDYIKNISRNNANPEKLLQFNNAVVLTLSLYFNSYVLFLESDAIFHL